MKEEKKILVIQPLPGIGDLFWFDGVMQSLSVFYEAPLTLMTKRQSQADKLYKKSNYVRNVLWLERPGIHGGIVGFVRLIMLLRQKKFSCVWVLHQSWRYRWACKMAGIQTIIFVLEKKDWQDLHPIQRAERLLKEHNIPYLKDPKFPIEESAEKHLKKDLSFYKKPWVALGIGGTDPSKKWVTSHFEDLSVWLSTTQKMSVFLLGGAREKEEAAEMVLNIQEKGGEATALTHFSLQQSMAFLNQVHFFVGNDTGMMNGAVVLNKPTFALFLSSPSLSYRACLTPLKPLPDSTDILLSQVQEVLGEVIKKG